MYTPGDSIWLIEERKREADQVAEARYWSQLAKQPQTDPYLLPLRYLLRLMKRVLSAFTGSSIHDESVYDGQAMPRMAPLTPSRTEPSKAQGRSSP